MSNQYPFAEALLSLVRARAGEFQWNDELAEAVTEARKLLTGDYVPLKGLAIRGIFEQWQRLHYLLNHNG